jgi:hypothetical protein
MSANSSKSILFFTQQSDILPHTVSFIKIRVFAREITYERDKESNG